MKIMVSASDGQWEELTTCSNNIEWIRVTGENTFMEYSSAAAYFNLNNSREHPDYSLLAKPVFINSVSTTLEELEAPLNVFRINGWSGFIQRPVWELAGPADENTKSVLTRLSKEIKIVADEPGLVAARIICMIINEAYFAIGDGVSSKDEIDTAMKLGTNYPFGPFEWAVTIGLENIVELLQKLTLSDKRYQPAPLLIKEAANDKP